jgi:hypothetical protein
LPMPLSTPSLLSRRVPLGLVSPTRGCAMTDAPRTGPPEKRERRPGQEAAILGKTGKVNNGEITTPPAHAQVPSLDRQRLWELALAVMPRGELRRNLPRYPEWCKRIGSDVWFQLMLDHELDPTEIQLLLDAHDRAKARRKHECEVAAKERELRALARQYMRGGR